jgi:hypothetical protein
MRRRRPSSAFPKSTERADNQPGEHGGEAVDDEEGEHQAAPRICPRRPIVITLTAKEAPMPNMKVSGEETGLIHRVTRRAIEMNGAWMNVDITLTVAQANGAGLNLAELLAAPDDVFRERIAALEADADW